MSSKIWIFYLWICCAAIYNHDFIIMFVSLYLLWDEVYTPTNFGINFGKYKSVKLASETTQLVWFRLIWGYLGPTNLIGEVTSFYKSRGLLSNCLSPSQTYAELALDHKQKHPRTNPPDSPGWFRKFLLFFASQSHIYGRCTPGLQTRITPDWAGQPPITPDYPRCSHGLVSE